MQSARINIQVFCRLVKELRLALLNHNIYDHNQNAISLWLNLVAISVTESNRYKSGFHLCVNLMPFAKYLCIRPEFVIKKVFSNMKHWKITLNLKFEWAWCSDVVGHSDPNRRKRSWFLWHDRTADWNLQIYTEWVVVHIIPQMWHIWSGKKLRMIYHS